MRILVCGGRDYEDKDRVFSVLDTLAREHSKYYNPKDNWLPSDILIIAGGAKGADDLAAAWAMVNWSGYKEYSAEWKKYGKSAGYRRNTQMLVEGNPDLVVAFPGGRGTAMMVDIAKKAGVEVLEIT